MAQGQTGWLILGGPGFSSISPDSTNSNVRMVLHVDGLCDSIRLRWKFFKFFTPIAIFVAYAVSGECSLQILRHRTVHNSNSRLMVNCGLSLTMLIFLAFQLAAIVSLWVEYCTRQQKLKFQPDRFNLYTLVINGVIPDILYTIWGVCNKCTKSYKLLFK